MHQDFLLTESVVSVIISINRKNRKEILRKKEIRLKKLGIIGYGLRSETMMKAFQGIQAPVQVAAVADPLWCQKQKAFAQTAEFAQTVFYETAEEMDVGKRKVRWCADRNTLQSTYEICGVGISEKDTIVFRKTSLH